LEAFWGAQSWADTAMTLPNPYRPWSPNFFARGPHKLLHNRYEGRASYIILFQDIDSAKSTNVLYLHCFLIIDKLFLRPDEVRESWFEDP